MADTPSLPTETVDNVARFFQNMDIPENEIRALSRQRSISQFTRMRSFSSSEDRIRNSRIAPRIMPHPGTYKENVIIQEPMMSDRNLITTTKADVFYTSAANDIYLTKREQAKFRALAKFKPGEIHNIPLNEKIPLPPIGRRLIVESDRRSRGLPSIMVPNGGAKSHGHNIFNSNNDIAKNSPSHIMTPTQGQAAYDTKRFQGHVNSQGITQFQNSLFGQGQGSKELFRFQGNNPAPCAGPEAVDNLGPALGGQPQSFT